MLFRLIRCILGLALAGSILAPSIAAAQDPTCRNGLFTRQDNIAQARVAMPGRTFFFEDMDGCPTSGSCRTNSFVIEGDRVLVGRTLGQFVCALFPNDVGGTAGWIERKRLTMEPTDPAPALSHWLGNWSDGASADVTIHFRGGHPYITGEAFWPARPEVNEWISIHIGEVNDRLSIIGNRASYSDDNLCELELTLLADFLLISDNYRCGGANVTFSGAYTRAR